MSTVLKLVQGSANWHAYRSAMRNASESSAVLGVSPWTTPYQLWLIKTGRQVQAANAAMMRGTELEPAARTAYEDLTGNIMQPLVLQDGRYSASLDGLTLDGKTILEIKVPMRGRQSTLWKDVEVGRVPVHYELQIQHQLMVSRAEIAHLWVSDGSEGVLYPISRDEAVMASIREAWDGFQHHLDSDTPPPLVDGDTVKREDANWSAAAALYLVAKREAEVADVKVDVAKQVLVALCNHPREQGAGVSVTRYWKVGNVDYKKIPELKVVELDKYRGAAREEVRITASK